MKKVGIIRCMQTEDMCPGTKDFMVAKSGQGIFSEMGPVEIVGFLSCGGCPGKRAVSRAAMLAQWGAEAVVLASCIKKGVPVGMPCPHFEAMSEAIKKKLPEGVALLDWSH